MHHTFDYVVLFIAIAGVLICSVLIVATERRAKARTKR